MRYRVAAIQYDPRLGEKERNIADLLRLVEEAAIHGARLIVLPEMATVGYCWESRNEIAPYVEPIPGPTTEHFHRLAACYGCFIAIGLAEVDPTTQVYYNSVALLGPEGLVGTYRKLHSYTSEPRWARDGDLGIPVWETPLGRLSTLVSMDAVYFEAARIPALHDVDVVLFPTNWFEEKCPCIYWIARAFENGVYLIAANRCGLEREARFSGGSCVLNPDGSIQAYLANGEGIVYGEVDLERSRDKRWGGQETVGHRFADRRPTEYIPVVHNSYLWEPLHYHSLYGLGELPTGQLSCIGIIQTHLPTIPAQSHARTLQTLHGMMQSFMHDYAPASPDVLVLPELILPGPVPRESSRQPDDTIAHFHDGAIQIPGPETQALVALAEELQISMVVSVAEKAEDVYYNTVLLIDPEGIYGLYRKIHLTQQDRLWASPGNLGFPTFDTAVGRIGLATGYDVLFPETLRVLAAKGADLVCAPAFLNFPDAIGLTPTCTSHHIHVEPQGHDPLRYPIWRVRAAEHNVYLALANWNGQYRDVAANGLSGIFSPTYTTYPCQEVIAEEDEPFLMMTVDTREQRTGRRTTHQLGYAPGDLAGSLTGELAYDPRDSIPGNVVRSKPLLRKRQPYWYLDVVRTEIPKP
jgi:predicted amidohydrolase